MNAARTKHGNWISAPSSSYDPYRGSYVGAVSAKGATELGKQGIVLSDQIVRDLDIPIMATALELMDRVFDIADKLGVGAEVRTAVYSIRGATYAGYVAANFVPASAVAASAGVLTSIGAVAALGAVAAVAVAVAALFGGPSDEEEAAAKARVKRAQSQILHLRDRLSLSDFAAEQDGAAMAASLSSAPSAERDRALKLAAFYRTAAKELDPTERALFESLSNLARWQATLVAYGKLGQAQKDAIDVMFGKTEPRLPYQLSGPMKAETAQLEKIVRTVQAGKTVGAPGAGSILLLLAAAAGGLYAAYNPAGAAALARSAGSKVSGAASAGAAKVKGLL